MENSIIRLVERRSGRGIEPEDAEILVNIIKDIKCVDRLLVKDYKPKDIILEKVYPSGHGTSGRLDVLVKKEGKAYLMIELRCEQVDQKIIFC